MTAMTTMIQSPTITNNQLSDTDWLFSFCHHPTTLSDLSFRHRSAFFLDSKQTNKPPFFPTSFLHVSPLHRVGKRRFRRVIRQEGKYGSVVGRDV